MALGVMAWLFSPRRPTPTEVLLFLGTAAGGLISARHIPLFAVVAPIVLSRHLLLVLDGTALYRLFSEEDEGQAPPTGMIQAVNRLIIVLVVGVGLLWTAVRISNNYLSVEKTFPVAAVDFLEESGLDETRIYNHYEWGGYLIWRRIPVFVDGRTELYGNEFFLTYLQAFEARGNWQEPLDEYDVETVIMPRNSALSTVLTASQGWQEVYGDGQARVFQRVGESS